MGYYVCIHRQIWNDDKFPYQSDDVRLMFFHLLTTPYMSQFGLAKISKYALADELGWNHHRYLLAFAQGIGLGFFEYDEKTQILWIPRFIKYNMPQSVNVLKAWVSAFNPLPNCELKVKAYEEIKGYAVALSDAFAKAWAKAFVPPSPLPLTIPSPLTPPSTTTTTTTTEGRVKVKSISKNNGFPPDFEITEHHKELAKTIGTQMGASIDLFAELEAFREYCDAHGKRYSNYNAAFCTRIRNIPKFGNPKKTDVYDAWAAKMEDKTKIRP